MIDAEWPERHDCALLTSKGYASRAAKDLLDLLGDSDEPLTIFCIHDADGPCTMIYQTLQEATRARPRRKVEIINLGLDPAEAIEMGLPIEPAVRESGRRVPVAEYIDDEWREWLQTQLIELDAMTTPMFLDWLDEKIEPYDTGKLIPPDDVLADRLRNDTRDIIHQRLTAEAILAARVCVPIRRSKKPFSSWARAPTARAPICGLSPLLSASGISLTCLFTSWSLTSLRRPDW